jgi:hypothetical protein
VNFVDKSSKLQFLNLDAFEFAQIPKFDAYRFAVLCLS